MVREIQQALKAESIPEKAAFFPTFFKTGKGQYSEGDQFIGVTVPKQRAIAKKFYKDITLVDLEKLLQSPIHEYRLTALFMLAEKYRKTKVESEQKEYVDFYLSHLAYVNNWDLVDSSSAVILGDYLLDKEPKILYSLAHSTDLWEKRVAMIATQRFIKAEELDNTFKIAEILLNDPHDLIHKAVGWMLREAGSVDLEAEKAFLDKHAATMPRTMLRYAIEKFPEPIRQRYLKAKDIIAT